jgi:hypothetical protein
MKYFTPERYLRLGNLNDEQAFLAAQEDWERAVAGYKDQLQRVRPGLPSRLGHLVDSIYLHDARVLDMWEGKRTRFNITLHPESDPSRLVVLAYSLEEPVSIEAGVLPAESCSEPVAWLYDELNVESGRLTHNILLSNGWEVRLRFRQVTVSRPLPLIPTVPDLGASRAIIPRFA